MRGRRSEALCWIWSRCGPSHTRVKSACLQWSTVVLKKDFSAEVLGFLDFSARLPVCLPARLPVCLSACFPACLPCLPASPSLVSLLTYLPARSPVHPPSSLSVRSPVRPPVCLLPVRLPACLPTRLLPCRPAYTLPCCFEVLYCSVFSQMQAFFVTARLHL